MEQIGIHKRDILIDRIEEAQAAQEEGQEQFKDALEQFKAAVNFDGGKLEDTYDRLGLRQVVIFTQIAANRVVDALKLDNTPV